MKLFLIILISACVVGFGSCRFVQNGNTRCLNVWDEGCNGGIPGAGKDEDFLNGGGNPGKRSVDTWDDRRNNGQYPESDEDILKNENPSKRCVNQWDDGCNNGGIPGSGKDEDFLNGGGSPGKRSVDKWDDERINGQYHGSDENILNNGNPAKRCANLWDEGCNNGEIPGSGKEEDFLNGGGSPGK